MKEERTSEIELAVEEEKEQLVVEEELVEEVRERVEAATLTVDAIRPLQAHSNIVRVEIPALAQLTATVRQATQRIVAPACLPTLPSTPGSTVRWWRSGR